MTLTLKRASHGLAHAVLAASTLLAAHGTAAAQDKPAPAASAASAAPAKDRKDDRALAVLKRMSDTLAGAKTLSFKVRGIVPTPAPTGQYVSLYASSSVVMQRPDKMFVAARGDLFPSDAWYDGKKVTVVGRDNRFYAQRDAEGGPLEALMNATQPASDATRTLPRPAGDRPLHLPDEGLHQRAVGGPDADRRRPNRPPRVHGAGPGLGDLDRHGGQAAAPHGRVVPHRRAPADVHRRIVGLEARPRQFRRRPSSQASRRTPSGSSSSRSARPSEPAKEQCDEAHQDTRSRRRRHGWRERPVVERQCMGRCGCTRRCRRRLPWRLRLSPWLSPGGLLRLRRGCGRSGRHRGGRGRGKRIPADNRGGRRSRPS